MFSVRCKTLNLCQWTYFRILALIYYARLPPGTTGVVCTMSPPSSIRIPPKRDSSLSLMSPIVRFVSAKQWLCCIGTSSKTISAVLFSKPASIDCFGIWDLLSSLLSIGILNVLCDVFPPGRSNSVSPEEATQKTILPCARKFRVCKKLANSWRRENHTTPTYSTGKCPTYPHRRDLLYCTSWSGMIEAIQTLDGVNDDVSSRNMTKPLPPSLRGQIVRLLLLQ